MGNISEQVPKSAWVAAGWLLEDQRQKAKAAGYRPTGFARFFDACLTTVSVIVAIPFILAGLAIGVGCAVIVLWFAYAFIFLTVTGGW